MNWLKNFINKQIDLNVNIDLLASNTSFAHTKLAALEDYLDIQYFQGDKSKPHYRKRRTFKRPVGRPRKNKSIEVTRDKTAGV